jgi:hypothetical protein
MFDLNYFVVSVGEATAAGTSVGAAGVVAGAVASGVAGITESTTEVCVREESTAKAIQVTTNTADTILVKVEAKVVAPVAPKTEFEELCVENTPPPFES